LDLFPEIDDVVTVEVHTKPRVECSDMGEKAFPGIFKREIPVLSVYPGELSLILVEGDEQVPVSHRYITRHGHPPL
jgi:hypothetical protein